MSRTQKLMNLLLWVRGLADSCSAEALSGFLFCMQLSYQQTVTSPLCSASPRTQVRKLMLWPCSAVGLLEQGYLRNIQSDHILSFCWTHPGNTDNYFLFHIKWPIASDWRAGENVVSLLQNEEKPVCLAGCEWPQPQKQLGTKLQVAAPFHKPMGRGKAAQWVLVLWLLPPLSAVVTPRTISHAGKAGPALHPHVLLPCSNAQQSWNWV